ncbi:hypothetical protein NP233_g7468 [Leucocoprinus birnbaumii]|uniref:Nephrocystin 3-like N-terminal domain-containing protein n=1 Tax=Leucocoprinus birnbaumii TaxID=56174 RepID=A0AAD5VQ47_9AGAR|nr:hypothetical protein NP233_g7468 [Leucocoprinus birnbaumii]
MVARVPLLVIADLGGNLKHDHHASTWAKAGSCVEYLRDWWLMMVGMVAAKGGRGDDWSDLNTSAVKDELMKDVVKRTMGLRIRLRMRLEINQGELGVDNKETGDDDDSESDEEESEQATDAPAQSSDSSKKPTLKASLQFAGPLVGDLKSHALMDPVNAPEAPSASPEVTSAGSTTRVSGLQTRSEQGTWFVTVYKHDSARIPSMFREAHNFSINNSNFESQQSTFQLHGNNHINIGPSDYHGTPAVGIPSSTEGSALGMALLLDASTPEASVDSVERNYKPRCFPGTREQYIEDITNWATSSGVDRLPIYWMKGPAGVGKSSIAQTSAMKVQEVGCLGAAFFFSINGRRNDHNRFFPSLAHQLSTVLLDYRNIVNERVLIDSTVFKKTMRAQFQSLIAGPLQKLKELGKEAPRMSIFIDGLDECKDKDAQAEIIEIIAESVQVQSTPFQWAIFSREEPRITSTFDLPEISPRCHVIYLPISRDTDKEIEAYLRGEFKNILCRRLGNIPLSTPWPTDEDIQKLIDAAAGLFAYAATIVRFIDSHSYSRFRETLQAILDNILNPRPHSLPVFANLDSLYTLILQGIPTDVASSAKLLLYWMSGGSPSSSFFVLADCNALGISEAAFKSICCYLHAVIVYYVPQVETSDMFAPGHPYLEQSLPLESNTALLLQLHQSGGTVKFHHRSFYDFLGDPNRSGSVFDRNDIRAQRLLRYYHQHLQVAPLYVVRGSKLELASDAPASDPSSLLSWPSGSKSLNSFLVLHTFCQCSGIFTGEHSTLPFCLKLIMKHLPVEAMEEFDFHKSLVGRGMIREREWDYESCPGEYFQYGEGVVFQCSKQEYYNQLGVSLLQMALEIEKLKIVNPFHPHCDPSVSMSTQSASSLSKLDRRHGLHSIGSGEKSVIWYWEYDEENNRYYEFRTLDYAKAIRILQSEKYKMWNNSWVLPPQLLEEDPVETNVPTVYIVSFIIGQSC